MVEASLGVSVVMRFADGGGADHLASKWGLGWVEGQGVSIVFISESGDVVV